MLKVLVIDDEPAVRNIIVRMLTKAGYDAIEAEHGQDGIDALIRSRYALVITDLMMPGLGGVETIHRIRELDPVVPIIAISGADDEPLEDAMLGGANMRLMKPFEMDDLLAAISILLSDDEV